MLVFGAFASLACLQLDDPKMIVTGKMISPIGVHTDIGSYPINAVLSPNGRHIAISNIGYRQNLTLLDARTGEVTASMPFNSRAQTPRQGLYFGIAFNPSSNQLFVSRGAQDFVASYKVDRIGTLSEERKSYSKKIPDGRKLPYHPAGIALFEAGQKMAVVQNQTGPTTDFKGSLSVVESETGKELGEVALSGYPFNLVVLTEGPRKDKIAYVASERDGLLDIVDLQAMKVLRTISTGSGPLGMVLNSEQSRLYVGNNGSDTVSVVDTSSSKIIDTISLRPNDMRGIPGAGPTSCTLSPDERTLFVTLGDMNAVAVVDLSKRALAGYVPTGWLPTSVVATKENLFVTCAKGVQAMNPNSPAVPNKGTYIQDIIEGTVSRIPMQALGQLDKLSAAVIRNNRLKRGLSGNRVEGFNNPGIKHVIYIVKENRTFDNVLGDLKGVNADPKLCLFPREVTPNQHALAERFVVLDNFYVCAEVSQDGWVWSTAGMVNAYASRNTPYNYSGRGRTYDTEGSNSGAPIDILGIPDVTRPTSGYIWEHAKKHNVTFRNYGFFTQFTDPSDKRFDDMKGVVDSMPTKKLLEGNTNVNFRRYDLQYADSDAYDLYDWSWTRRMKTYGKYGSKSRFSEWKREFDQFVKAGKMPRYQLIRFGQDHTSGTSNGQPTAKSMVADNDYAVGQLVEAISNSPFWKSTAICILEDDAQAGIDHVDAHRSTAYVISPFIKKGTVDSRFYNTDSMLRTMNLLLGMPAMSQYDAVASPIAVFSPNAENIEPFKAILPSRAIICQQNSANAYRSKDSDKIARYVEESEMDEDLNDILWKSIKGVHAPTPKPRFGVRWGRQVDRD